MNSPRDERSLKDQMSDYAAKKGREWMAKATDQVKERVKEAPREMGNALDAAIRQGASELANSIVPAFPDSMRPVEVAGGVGNPTQAELSMAKGVYGYGREDAKETDVHGPKAEKSHEPHHEPDLEP